MDLNKILSNPSVFEIWSYKTTKCTPCGCGAATKQIAPLMDSLSTSPTMTKGSTCGDMWYCSPKKMTFRNIGSKLAYCSLYCKMSVLHPTDKWRPLKDVSPAPKFFKLRHLKDNFGTIHQFFKLCLSGQRGHCTLKITIVPLLVNWDTESQK